MKTSKYLLAIASVAAMFAVTPALADEAQPADDGKSYDTYFMSPVNEESQAKIVAKIQANIAARKGPCTDDLIDNINEWPGGFVRGLSRIKCEKAPNGALLFGSSLQKINGKPARISYLHYVTEDKSFDVLTAADR